MKDPILMCMTGVTESINYPGRSSIHKKYKNGFSVTDESWMASYGALDETP